MARPQQSADRHAGSSFTIKNILNLPDDPNESIEPIQHALGFDVAFPPTHKPPMRVSAPPHVNRSSCSDCWSYRPWTVSFTQLYPRGLRGNTGFARDPRLSLVGNNNNRLELRRRGLGRKKKQRSLFSSIQVQRMEKDFDSKKYLTEGRRAELAVELKLTETQVKTWFQNRRTKWRKELRNENPPREVPDGRVKHSLEARK